jgi:hypothetical protein
VTAHDEGRRAEDEPGRQVFRLRVERDRPLDVARLAASLLQIKSFGICVTDPLGDEPTARRRETLAPPPVKER